MRTPKKGSKVTTDPKETIKKIPTPRMVKLNSGEQLVAIVMVQDKSDFIRLEEPYIIQLHPYDLLGDYMMEEKMTIKPWLFKSKDKVISNMLQASSNTKWNRSSSSISNIEFIISFLFLFLI